MDCLLNKGKAPNTRRTGAACGPLVLLAVPLMELFVSSSTDVSMWGTLSGAAAA